MVHRWRYRVLTLILLLSTGSACFGAELEVRFGALQRLISDQMFTTEGRRYVRGDRSAKCLFAYLENPKIAGVGNLLEMKVKFSGKMALNLMGNCVGLGDSFDLTLLGKPVVRGGAVGFDQMQVSTARDNLYIRRVRKALVETINKDFKIDVIGQARKLLEIPKSSAAPASPYQQELQGLVLRGIRVTKEALVLDVDFRLVVK